VSKKFFPKIIVIGLLISTGLGVVQTKARVEDVVLLGCIRSASLIGAYFYNSFIYHQAKRQYDIIKSFLHDRDYNKLYALARRFYEARWFSLRKVENIKRNTTMQHIEIKN